MDFCMDFSLLWYYVCIWRITLMRRWEWWLKPVSPPGGSGQKLGAFLLNTNVCKARVNIYGQLWSWKWKWSCEIWNSTGRVKKDDGNFGQGAVTADTSVSLSVLVQFLLQANLRSLEPFGLVLLPLHDKDLLWRTISMAATCKIVPMFFCYNFFVSLICFADTDEDTVKRCFATFEEKFFQTCEKELAKINIFYSGKVLILCVFVENPQQKKGPEGPKLSG